jgi:hypothetical protein
VGPTTSHGLLQPIFSDQPFDIVGLDLFGPFKVSNAGNKTCLTITDHFSHWVELVPLPNETAAVVADAFFNNWICRYGCPKRVITDQGVQFVSDVFARLNELMQVKHKSTTPYHPQTNGFTERRHRSLKALLQTVVDGNQRD